ncbi:hypothetical protein D6D20_04414 [Aureobasidium pullulans]|uniref:Uncharacterized protein n=2 Tax=Aureobasidium pullulans TaxID=5580 RepID=A0A4S8ZB62_AURPU|nr:hypothetical protein D6D20_04414 [Aureobasidium pullulans]THZ94904.1 hypothetical protein D6C82_08024 [Aureobasidium pullulans]
MNFMINMSARLSDEMLNLARTTFAKWMTWWQWNGLSWNIHHSYTCQQTVRLGRQSGDSGTLLLLSLMAMRFIVDCAHNYLLGVPAAREGKTPSKDDVSGLIQWHAGRNLQYR